MCCTPADVSVIAIGCHNCSYVDICGNIWTLLKVLQRKPLTGSQAVCLVVVFPQRCIDATASFGNNKDLTRQRGTQPNVDSI